MRKKLFISIPMSGVEDTVTKRFNKALEIIKSNEKLKEYEIVAPFDINTSFNENGLTESANEHDTAYWMGKDIELLLRCDAIYSCEGWRNSKGCQTERATAAIYGLELYDFTC